MKKLSLFLFCLFLMPALVNAAEVYTDNVVIVFDASGSMADSMRDANRNRVVKIDAAKNALIKVLDYVPATTDIGLVVFGSRDGWFHELGNKDRKQLKNAIKSIHPGGGTPLGEYIKTGADSLLQARKKQYGYGSYRLLVVTDGEASDAGKVRKYTPDILSRGITLDVIGVAMDNNHVLADKAHSYRTADNPASLVAVLKEVLAEVSTQGTDGVSSEELFAEIAAIPSETATAMLKAFAGSGNHPIGKRPPRPVVQRQVQQQTPQATKPEDNGNGGCLAMSMGLLGSMAGVAIKLRFC